SQGLGAGKLLCNAAIKRAKEMGASSLILFSETTLASAIHIYRMSGFKEIPIEKGKYHRANIMMKLDLDDIYRYATGESSLKKT
ncbi:MAG: GNAT family N-acetyltransferase, partial [Bacteroidota bacterium]|nr:GNAT family N-acetyltransferase [Bacteroidota bacterium]